MKKNKNGFIATSLIYSFFLVFLALILILINSYVQTKMITERFNEEVYKDLNGDIYKIIVKAKNAVVIGGISLLNNAYNGNFSEGLKYWEKDGAETVLSEDGVGIFGSTNSHIFEDIEEKFIEGHIYYLGLIYKQNHDNPLKVYLDGELDSTITTENTNNSSKKDGVVFKINSNGNKRLIVGKNEDASLNETQITYFKDIVLIDITNYITSYKKNKTSYEIADAPNKKWLLDNIDYFDKTISYYSTEWQEGKDSIEIFMSPYKSTNPEIKNKYCYDSKGNAVNIDVDVENKKMNFENLNNDVSCYVEWKVDGED